MRAGFIGTGSMGSILLEAFIAEGALQASQITASNRTTEKVLQLSHKYPGLNVALNNRITIDNSDIIFLCIRPADYKKVIDEIQSHVRKEQLIISITSPVLLKDLENQIPCKVAKVIPSITNSVAAGASLVMFGESCTREDRDLLLSLISRISKPIQINEEITRVSSDIVSCGPAFISYILQRFITAAVEETGITLEQATFLTSEMMVGFGKLISEGPFNLETLQRRVCVPGGITGAGIQALEENLRDTFNQVFRNTHRKFKTDLQEVVDMFNNN